MPNAEESVANGSGSQLRSALGAGLDTISENATVPFTRFVRTVLPVDGFVFWVKADIMSPSSVPGTSTLNSFTLNAAQVALQAAPTTQVKGSLHHTTLNQQDEAESFSLHRMTFTSQDPVDALNAVAPGELWIGEFDGLRLAFSSRTGWYEQAGTYHYHGDALYPALASQIIDDPADFDQRQVVSNSLPIWLGLSDGEFPLYPSYLVPDNIEPPYGVIHIGEEDTETLQGAPYFDQTGTRWLLCADRVKVTTYGVRNDAIQDWIDAVCDFTVNYPFIMGVMDVVPPVRDSKRGQTEFSVLAQRKVVKFRVSYHQLRVNDLARKLISEAVVNFAFVPASDIDWATVTFTPGPPAPPAIA